MIRPFLLQVSTVLLASALTIGNAAAGDFRVWSSETAPERTAIIGYLSDLFGALHEDIEVTYTSVPDNELLDRIEAAAPDERPSVIHTGGNFLASLGVAGHLDDAATTRLIHQLGRRDFFSGTLDMMASPLGVSSYWGVPLHGWAQGIWYRTDLFETAGLDAPSNWEAIEAAAAALHDPEAGRYGILLGTGADTYAEQVFHHIAMSNGVALFDRTGNLTFNTPEAVEALALMVRLSEFTPPDATGWRGRDFYLQGRLGMMFYSTFIMDDLALPSVAANSLGTENFAALSGAEFDPNLVHVTGFQASIEKTRPAVFGSIAGVGITSNLSDAEKDMADRFIRFLFEPSTYIAWLHMAPGGMLPVRRHVAGTEDFFADPQRVFARYGRKRVAHINSGLELVSSLYALKGEQTRIAAQIFSAGIIPRMIYRAVHENVPAEQAVADAASEMQSLM